MTRYVSKQNIVNGSQKSQPDYWLEYGNRGNSNATTPRYKVRLVVTFSRKVKKTRWIEPKRCWESLTIR
ncbi:hypothetical protein ACNKHX_20990 [Shigella flexneri]